MQSMITSIILNKQMSLFRKMKRLQVYLCILSEKVIRKAFGVVLLALIFEHSELSYKKLFLYIRRQEKKGYQVRLVLQLRKKDSCHTKIKFDQALAQQINLETLSV